jgi:hypothetical protein
VSNSQSAFLVSGLDSVQEELSPNITMMLRAAAGHTTIIDAYMSLAILGDDKARYKNAVELFHTTGGNFAARCSTSRCAAGAMTRPVPRAC